MRDHTEGKCPRGGSPKQASSHPTYSTREPSSPKSAAANLAQKELPTSPRIYATFAWFVTQQWMTDSKPFRSHDFIKHSCPQFSCLNHFRII